MPMQPRRAFDAMRYERCRRQRRLPSLTTPRHYRRATQLAWRYAITAEHAVSLSRRHYATIAADAPRRLPPLPIAVERRRWRRGVRGGGRRCQQDMLRSAIASLRADAVTVRHEQTEPLRTRRARLTRPASPVSRRRRRRFPTRARIRQCRRLPERRLPLPLARSILNTVHAP